jgi:hypothetical protein
MTSSHELISSAGDDNDNHSNSKALMQVAISQFGRLTMVFGALCALLVINMMFFQHQTIVQVNPVTTSTRQVTSDESNASTQSSVQPSPTVAPPQPSNFGDKCVIPILRAASIANYQKIDLAPYNAITQEITTWLGDEFPALEGHSAQLTLERQLYVSQASRPEIRTVCEV